MGWGQAPCDNSDLIVGTYNMALNGIDLGSTTGGVSIVKNAEYNEVRNDQSCLRQGIHETQQEWSATFEFKPVDKKALDVIFGKKKKLTWWQKLLRLIA